jgi:hypothetical protein
MSFRAIFYYMQKISRKYLFVENSWIFMNSVNCNKYFNARKVLNSKLNSDEKKIG